MATKLKPKELKNLAAQVILAAADAILAGQTRVSIKDAAENFISECPESQIPLFLKTVSGVLDYYPERQHLCSNDLALGYIEAVYSFLEDANPSGVSDMIGVVTGD